MSKPKVLFLHGYGESSLMAGMSTAALKKAVDEAKCELLPVPDGYHKLKSSTDFKPIADEDYRSMCQAGELDAFAWYPLRDPKLGKGDGGSRAKPAKDFEFRAEPSGMSTAVKKLLADIDNMGGVDAIFGFSQGGELAYLLGESTNLMKAKTKDKLKFIVRALRTIALGAPYPTLLTHQDLTCLALDSCAGNIRRGGSLSEAWQVALRPAVGLRSLLHLLWRWRRGCCGRLQNHTGCPRGRRRADGGGAPSS
jgi:hypothetical protein